VVFPLLRIALAILFLDTWQYFLHRLMHTYTYLYKTFHSRHHRLYVPYAFGALYNHWFEGLLLDTVGAGLGYKFARLSTREGMLFFGFSTMKTVDDHCGYALPFDPLQMLFPNNSSYHDIHHQTFGIKTNFSQPFFTFWDRVLGTQYVPKARASPAQQQEFDEKRAAGLVRQRDAEFDGEGEKKEIVTRRRARVNGNAK